MKLRIISFILALAMLLSCLGFVGCNSSDKDDEECRHRDRDGDSVCDKCDEELEDDEDSDKECEHIDQNGNGRCDKCFKKMENSSQGGDDPDKDWGTGSGDSGENDPDGGNPDGGGNADNPAGGENGDGDNPDGDHNSGNSGSLGYSVAFTDVDGEVYLSYIETAGSYLEEYLPPEKEGYVFLGWFLDSEPWSFTENKLDGDIVLVARWEELPPPQPEGISDEEYTGDIIYVGNTAATSGVMAQIGTPFNIGIEAAFSAYNAKGGFGGRMVKLKNYDDMGDAASSAVLMEKLIFEDEVFAVVGNFGNYAVEANIDILKENYVPMIYAASVSSVLYNTNAVSDGDRCIFPVQPLGATEGKSLILRAFAPMYGAGGQIIGGFNASKVGVIYGTDAESRFIVQGIKEEEAYSDLSGIHYYEVSSGDYSAAANSIVSLGCDAVIVTVGGADFINALSALADAGFKGSALTTVNNGAEISRFNIDGILSETGRKILYSMNVYNQAWIDINDLSYHYYEPDTDLYNLYKFLGMVEKDASGNELGVPGFSEEYWTVANHIFDYATTISPGSAFSMSYNSYAIAGYIAGSVFCQALEKMEAEGEALTRKNLVEALESEKLDVAMSGSISYLNGLREGINSFSLNLFYDEGMGSNYSYASSLAFSGFVSIDELRMYLGK